MVIKKIIFKNILTYHGVQTLELPSIEDSSLTVVVGPNNSGKTSIIRALKFWFYGEDGVPKRSDLPLFLSNKAKAEVPVGSTLTGWVEVTFERTGFRGKETICLRRILEIKRASEDRWTTNEVKLEHIKPGSRPIIEEDKGGRYQRMIEGMVPRLLFDAFYFKGEPLDGKLLGDVGSIRDALGQFLHEDQWKEAEEAAEAISESLAKKVTKLTAANSELTKKVAHQHQNEAKLKAQREALDQEEAELLAVREEYKEEAEKLSRLGDEKVAREAKRQLTEAQQRLTRAKARFETADEEIVREIGNSLGVPFLTAAIAPVAEILKEMEDDNILPADITPGFVDRVLKNKTCICGKQHDEGSRSHWEEYRKKTLAADAGEGLRKLLDWVKPKGALSIAQRTTQITADLQGLIKERTEAAREQNAAQADLKAAERALENVPIEEISRIGKALTALQGKITNHTNRIGIFKQHVQATEFEGKNLKEEIKTLSAKSGINQNEFRDLTAAQDRAQRLHQALTDCRKRLSHYFHRVLQSSVAQYYDSKATDGSTAHIDRQTLLPSIHVNGHRTQNLGGGQSQLLTLAYVVSLARLRQSMHSELESLGVKLGKIDDLSFFMDSPFGHMERHYKEAALQLIPGCARQVMVLLWKEEWDFARTRYEQEADKIYAIQFSATPEDVSKISKEDRTYSITGIKKELIQNLPAGAAHPHSELIKIQ
jgi:DNA sulfur modification protein DndD